MFIQCWTLWVDFCRFSCLFLLLTKLLFGVIRDLNGLWCSTENIYSIYWRSMPAVFRFQAVCVCVRAQCVWVCERVSRNTFWAKQRGNEQRRSHTRSLSSWHAFCMLNTNRGALKFLFCNCIHDGHRRRALNLRARFFLHKHEKPKNTQKKTNKSQQ